jgi:hypothetical protein
MIAIFRERVLVWAAFLLLLSIFFGRRAGGKWVFSILPSFFSISSISLLYLIGGRMEQQVFIFLSSFMYYLALFGAYRLGRYPLDQTAKGMVVAATASTIFFTYTSFYGLYLNFLVPIYVLMLSYVLVTLLVSYQHLSLLEKDNKFLVWTYSFVLAASMAEIIWTMNFWPFGYLTTGTVALILYYVLWDLIGSYLSGFLSKKRVVGNTILFSLLIILILLSSKWIPVI